MLAKHSTIIGALFLIACLPARTALALEVIQCTSPQETGLAQQIKLSDIVRDLEADSRELYFTQSVALLQELSDDPDWVGRMSPRDAIVHQTGSHYEPNLNRLRAQLSNLEDVPPLQRKMLLDAVWSIRQAIGAGFEISESLKEDDLDGAITIFRTRSLPNFRSAWADLYTLKREFDVAYSQE